MFATSDFVWFREQADSCWLPKYQVLMGGQNDWLFNSRDPYAAMSTIAVKIKVFLGNPTTSSKDSVL